MSDNDSDDEFERRYPQKPPGMPLWAILLIVFGSVGVIGCIGVFALGFVGWAFVPAPTPPPPVVANMSQPPSRLQQIYPRAEFERMVLGKTLAEMKATFGEPPLSVGENGTETWMYESLTSDPVTGRMDGTTEVVFRGGKVVRVDYRDSDLPGGGPPPGAPGPPPPIGVPGPPPPGR